MVFSTQRIAAPFTRALVLANPVAGRGRGTAFAREISLGLASKGIHSEVYLTRGRSDAAERVRQLDPAVDLLVCVGGDGTLREVLEGQAGRQIPVAVMPLGTANVLALDLGLPRSVGQCVEVILGRHVQEIDLALVNDQLSFLVTGIGVDGATLRELELRRRGPIRKLSYVPALLGALRRYQEPRLEVAIDGEALPGTFGLVLVSNIVHYGGIMRLSRERRFDDGLFEVLLFPRANLAALARTAMWGAALGLPRKNLCRLRQAQRVRVTSSIPVPYQIDGEYGGTTPVDFMVTGRRARVLVPAPNPQAQP